MRPAFIGSPPMAGIDPKMRAYVEWVNQALTEIERASYDDAITAVDALTVANYTESRSLDASTATATEVADFLCTLIKDLQNRGTKRNQ